MGCGTTRKVREEDTVSCQMPEVHSLFQGLDSFSKEIEGAFSKLFKKTERFKEKSGGTSLVNSMPCMLISFLISTSSLIISETDPFVLVDSKDFYSYQLKILKAWTAMLNSYQEVSKDMEKFTTEIKLLVENAKCYQESIKKIIEEKQASPEDAASAIKLAHSKTKKAKKTVEVYRNLNSLVSSIETTLSELQSKWSSTEQIDKLRAISEKAREQQLKNQHDLILTYWSEIVLVI